MTDERLRTAEQRYRKSGDDLDRRIWIAEIQRAGLLVPPFEVQLKPEKTGTQFSPPAKNKWYRIAKWLEVKENNKFLLRTCCLHTANQGALLINNKSKFEDDGIRWKLFQATVPTTFWIDFVLEFRPVTLSLKQQEKVEKWEKRQLQIARYIQTSPVLTRGAFGTIFAQDYWE